MKWIIRRGGDARHYGPLDNATIRRWAWDGYIQAPDEFSEDGGITWIRAGELAWLAEFFADREQATALVGGVAPPGHYGPSRKTRSLLDLTPMIDCVFLLLLFFFVTATFEKQAPGTVAEAGQSKADVNLDVSVPRVEEKPSGALDSSSRLFVIVEADGSVVFEGQPHSLHSLQQAMQRQREDKHPWTVIVLANPDVQYRHIAATVAAIEAAGIERVLLGATGPDE